MKDETKDNSFYLKHIVASINKIRRYLDGVTFEGFCKDDMRISAVTREIEIIGEAASKLAKDFKETHKNVPWRDIIDILTCGTYSSITILV